MNNVDKIRLALALVFLGLGTWVVVRVVQVSSETGSGSGGLLFAIPFFALGFGILIVLNNERFEREKIRSERESFKGASGELQRKMR
jgi:formate/nitrite transporter FocA (FNT family)